MTSLLIFAMFLQSPHVNTVTAVQPIVVSKFTLGAPITYVIGADGVARTCPDIKGVGAFIRVETAKSPNVFQYVLPGSMLRSTDKVAYTLACLKVE